MFTGAKIFIGVVFGLICLSFIATTLSLFLEYRDAGWFTIATFYSHLFLFFPTFGIVALLAFFTPSCVFLDMYWRYVPYGRIRFVIGFFLVTGLALAAAYALASSNERSIWEVAPGVLATDKGEPAGCMGSENDCERLAIMAAVENVRAVSQRRIGLSDLARNCKPDPLIQTIEAPQASRFCFATTIYRSEPPLVGDGECCRAQRMFADAMRTLHAPAENRSFTGHIHRWLLPFKTFFMLILLVISIMLAAWRNTIETHYAEFMRPIERGVLIGAVAMLFYPVMNHAFLQSAVLLYGGSENSAYRTPAPFFSFAFGSWALLLVFFFYRRRNKEVEALGRIGGLIASAIAIVKYDLIIDFFVRVTGTGAEPAYIGILAVLAVAAVVALYHKTADELDADGPTPEPRPEPRTVDPAERQT
jgi:hypothetical protein